MQPEEFRACVRKVVEEGERLTRGEARRLLLTLLVEPVMGGPQAGAGAGLSRLLPVPQELGLAALLAAMAQRGESADELCGFAEAMRGAATTIPLTDAERARLIDTCGTGGDGLDTLNISTAAALVAAGAGAWIAKHGNRAVTSRCGSADVLEALGVPIGLAPEAAAACLRETRFMFLLAPMLHPAMGRVGPVRRALPFRTIFNLAGPLANPAGAAAQVVGVYAEERVPVVAEALRLLGTRHAWVVHGRVPGSARGLDELTVTGRSIYASVATGDSPAVAFPPSHGEPSHGDWSQPPPAAMHALEIDPEELGFGLAPLESLRGGATAKENAALIEAILRGEDRGARRQIVLLNAGAALVVAGHAGTLAEGIALAAESVDRGGAMDVLGKLRAFASASFAAESR